MPELYLDVFGDTFAPGAECRGEVQWSLARPPVRGELRLLWETVGKGHPEDCVAGYLPLRELPRPSEPIPGSDPYRKLAPRPSIAPLEARDHRCFTLTLPLGPCSFAGQLIALRWSLVVVAGAMSCSHTFALTPKPACPTAHA